MARDRIQTIRRRQCDGRGTLRTAFALLAPVLLASVLFSFLPDAAAAGEITQHPGGFWKCRPPGNVKGAFDNEDPVALAARAHVATDCALHWSDGHGATYCFASPPSLLLFKDDPDAILQKAQAFWRTSHTQK